MGSLIADIDLQALYACFSEVSAQEVDRGAMPVRVSQAYSREGCQ